MTALPLQLQPISFRELVPSITSTSYLTHALYYYPAKFIPQVVHWCIDTYTQPGDWVCDPFGGSGTVGLEAYLAQRSAYLLDINRLVDYFLPIKIYRGKSPLSDAILAQLLTATFASQYEFYPAWRNVQHWYPPEMLAELARYWGYQKTLDQADIYAKLLAAALVKASKLFSWAEHRTPKLFISKIKRAELSEQLKQDWRTQLQDYVRAQAMQGLRNVNALIAQTAAHDVPLTFVGGVDSVHYTFPPATRFQAVISSPPYLQAQEYIRTIKLDLYWLGYSEAEVKRLHKLEIPYRPAEWQVQTPTLAAARAQIIRPDLLKMLDSYFSHTIAALQNAMNHLLPGGHACIFIGSPLVGGVSVEIWRVFAEYFSEHGFRVQAVYADQIKNRQLFRARNNKNPDGMTHEYLLVLERHPDQSVAQAALAFE